MNEDLNQLIDTAIKFCQTRSYVTPRILETALKIDRDKAETIFGELEKMGILSYFWAKEYEGILMSKVDRKKLREFIVN